MSNPSEKPQGEAQAAPVVPRERNAIYQNGRLVGRALDVEVDLDTKEIRFGEIYESDYLALPDECEYDKYRILIQKVAFASKIMRESPEKGRVLRGATAEILGFREQ